MYSAVGCYGKKRIWSEFEVHNTNTELAKHVIIVNILFPNHTFFTLSNSNKQRIYIYTCIFQFRENHKYFLEQEIPFFLKMVIPITSFPQPTQVVSYEAEGTRLVANNWVSRVLTCSQ